MDRKTFLIAAVAVFVVYQILNFLVYEVLLADAWTASDVLRPDADMMSKMWIMWLTGLLWSFIFVYLFHSVRQGPGVMEGVRYGFCIGLFVMVPTAYNSYATLPIAHSLALTWFVYGMLQVILCGVVVSLVYKPEKAASGGAPQEASQPASTTDTAA